MSMISAPRHDEGKFEFRLLMWVAFSVFLVAIAFSRLLPASVRPRIGGDGKGKRQSVHGSGLVLGMMVLCNSSKKMLLCNDTV